MGARSLWLCWRAADDAALAWRALAVGRRAVYQRVAIFCFSACVVIPWTRPRQPPPSHGRSQRWCPTRSVSARRSFVGPEPCSYPLNMATARGAAARKTPVTFGLSDAVARGWGAEAEIHPWRAASRGSGIGDGGVDGGGFDDGGEVRGGEAGTSGGHGDRNGRPRRRCGWPHVAAALGRRIDGATFGSCEYGDAVDASSSASWAKPRRTFSVIANCNAPLHDHIEFTPVGRRTHSLQRTSSGGTTRTAHYSCCVPAQRRHQRNWSGFE